MITWYRCAVVATVCALAAGCGRWGFANATGDDDARDARDDAGDGAAPRRVWLVTADYQDPTGILTVLAIDPASGALTPTPQGPVASEPTPSYFAVSPDGRHIYVPHENPQSQISGFALDPVTGALTELPGSPFPGAGTQNQIAVMHPGGELVYVKGSAGIQAYRRDVDTGALAKVGSPVGVPGVFLVAMDPLGRFLYASEYLSGALHGFRIDATSGALTSLGPPVDPGANGTHGLAFDPQGRFLVMLLTSDTTTRAFAVDPATGAVTPVSPSAPGGGRWLTFSDGGRRMIAADGASGLWSFAFDPPSGAMAPAPGAPFSAATRYWYVVTDPDGRFLYASDVTALSAFAIDPSGALLPLQLPAMPAVRPLAMGVITTGG